jgi:Ca-activated chloride channel family protein
MNGLDWIHFIRPVWLSALPLTVLLPWLWRRSRRPSGDWERVCDPHLLRWLSHQEAAGGARRSRGHWAAGAALALAVLALAGPSWQQLPDGSFSARDARVMVLDLSNSMLAQDLRPDRLTRARFRLADLLSETQEGQTGLVAYAGDAYVVSPLTTDTHTIANLLPALRPDVMPVGGSRADLALGMAVTLLERAGFSRGQVLLVSDSATSADAAKARELRDRGVITSVLAVGTMEGSPIPSGGGFITDRNGNVVITRLDAARLQDVAAAGGGKYSELNTMAVTHESPWPTVQGGEFTRRQEALEQRWKDAGPWLVLVLLPLAVASFRRGVLFLLPLWVLAGGLCLPEARANGWDDVWQRRDQQAWQALKNEESDRAAALAVDPGLAGEAWYRGGNFDNALGAWSKLDTADGYYNQGNALAQLGEFDAALKAYDQALALDPAMEDARVNRELVEQMRQQQQEQEQQNGEGESQQGESSDQTGEGEAAEQAGGESSDQAEAGEQPQGEQETEQGEGKQGDEQKDQPNYAESWSEEDDQAMEQWLRRIPDDPGGLLRRKFMNEHRRRGAPGDESKPW